MPQDPQYLRRVDYLRQTGRHEEAEMEIREHLAKWTQRQTEMDRACKIERIVREK